MRRYAVTVGPGERSVEVEIHDERAGGAGSIRVVSEGIERLLDLRAAGPVRYTWVDAGRVVSAEIEPRAGKDAPQGPGEPRKLAVSVRGDTFTVGVKDARAVDVPVVGHAPRATGPVVIRAPMPGRVVKLLAQVGGEVRAGAGLVVVEAMKMENELRAPRDGRVMEIRAREGEAVEAGQDLVVLE